MTDQTDDRPGWGGWDYVPELRTGSLDDPVACGYENTNFGVRGRGNEWQIIKVKPDESIVVEDRVFLTALEAMQKVERRANS